MSFTNCDSFGCEMFLLWKLAIISEKLFKNMFRKLLELFLACGTAFSHFVTIFWRRLVLHLRAGCTITQSVSLTLNEIGLLTCITWPYIALYCVTESGAICRRELALSCRTSWETRAIANETKEYLYSITNLLHQQGHKWRVHVCNSCAVNIYEIFNVTFRRRNSNFVHFP
jgi:hypothetical protein